MVLIRIHSIKAYIMGILLLLFIIANFIMQAVRRHRLRMTFYETDQHSNSNVRMYAIAMYALQGVGMFLIKEYFEKTQEAALRSELPNMLTTMLLHVCCYCSVLVAVRAQFPQFHELPCQLRYREVAFFLVPCLHS